jgi:phospholipid transport system substrate-binding protein
MIKLRIAFAALAVPATLALPLMTAPAAAAVDGSDPQRFVQTLTTDGFAAMRTGSRASARAQFRTLLAQHVAVDAIGDRLIRRWLPTITPAQKAAYKSALPNYIVGTYADRLMEYSDATIHVLRTQPTSDGMADVMTQVIKPGRQPIPAVWSVMQVGGAWKVANLRVAGINVAMAQAADFDSVIQRQGFDALVKMMQGRD